VFGGLRRFRQRNDCAKMQHGEFDDGIVEVVDDDHFIEPREAI
jgi:hypothetical protein